MVSHTHSLQIGPTHVNSYGDEHLIRSSTNTTSILDTTHTSDTTKRFIKKDSPPLTKRSVLINYAIY
jgi:hypothetical protein